MERFRERFGVKECWSGNSNNDVWKKTSSRNWFSRIPASEKKIKKRYLTFKKLALINPKIDNKYKFQL